MVDGQGGKYNAQPKYEAPDFTVRGLDILGLNAAWAHSPVGGVICV